MAKSDWILPCADSTCGKAFHPDRQSAEGHRIALEFWDQATGRTRKNHRLVSYRCRRCGGYHLGKKRQPEHPGVVELHQIRDEFPSVQQHPELVVPIDTHELEPSWSASQWFLSDF